MSKNQHHHFSVTRFESMLKTNSVYFFDSNEFEEVIQYYLEQGKMALAKKATKLALDQHPTCVSLKLYSVEIYVFENELDKAENLLNELFLLEPSNEEIYIQKANILSRRDQHKEAITLLEKALELTNDESDVLSLLGMEYLFLDDFENAKHFFIKCVEQDEEDFSSLYNIIYCFEYLEQYEEAIIYLNQYLDSNPYCEVAWHQIGKQYYLLKDYKKALAAYDFAIISDDCFVGAYLEKGKVLEKLKRYHEAIESYTVTLGLEEPTSFALLRIGVCYEKLNNFDLALNFYNKCVEEDPLLDKGWIAITDFYSNKKDYKKALYFIEKAINIDSENIKYWKRYASLCQKLYLYEEAEHGYRKALELGNYELKTWLSRNDVLMKIGEYNAAINNLFQAAEFYPDCAEIEYRLAGLHFKISEKNKGEFHLKNALKLEPEYALILEELFPNIYNKSWVQKIIKKHKNTSLK